MSHAWQNSNEVWSNGKQLRDGQVIVQELRLLNANIGSMALNLESIAQSLAIIAAAQAESEEK